MSDNLSKKDIEKIVGKSTNEILEVMQTFMYQVDERFKQVEKRLDNFETRFDERFGNLTNVIDGYVGKIDMYAQEMAAMSHKINRLERYIQVLAEKAGVDLDKIHA
jgi:archaellum component FlaC